MPSFLPTRFSHRITAVLTAKVMAKVITKVMAKVMTSATALVISGAAYAQDLQGRDTPGNWRVTHHESFGIWNSFCDEREEGGTLVQRCYLRRVDVYAQDPFGALFMFLTPKAGGYEIDLGVEPGTSFVSNGLRVEGSEGILWAMERASCLTFGNCTFETAETQAALTAMQSGAALHLDFVGPHGRSFDLMWSLDGFSEAFADFQTQWSARQS